MDSGDFLMGDSLLGLFRPYRLPLPDQLLPKILLDREAQALVEDDDFLLRSGYYVKESRNIFKFAMWASISAYLKDVGYHTAADIPFQALPQADGSLGKNEPQLTNVFDSPPATGSLGAFWAPWLGCRCSWPVTQQCWYLCLGAQVVQWATVCIAVLTIAFQLFILDAIVEANFLAKVLNIILYGRQMCIAHSYTPHARGSAHSS